MEMPYENLYIYYINGKVAADRKLFGNGFVGNWQEEDCAFLFFAEPADERVESILAKSDGLKIKDRFLMSYADWIGGAPDAFTAGDFRIVPPWLVSTEKQCCQNTILLDPGVVFGSGTHATTRDCIDALEFVFLNTRVSKTIDLGCGTGLLSLVVARMGSEQTLAVDINHLAVETTRNNICHNDLTARVLAVQGNALDFITLEADLLVANIHYDVMKEIVCSEGFFRKKWFVLSGLLRSQVGPIEASLRQSGAVIEHRMIGDGIWYTIVGRFSV